MKQKKINNWISWALLAGGVFLYPYIASAADPIYVQVKATKLRSSPAMWAGAISDLSYGDKLSPIAGGDEGWVKVKSTSGKIGYVHISAISSKEIVLTSTKNAQTYASSDEIVLAGKGFNREVEQTYAKKSHLDFAAVDAVERQKVGNTEVASFIRNGKLGGAK